MQLIKITGKTPFDYEKISVTTSVKRLDETKRNTYSAVLLTIETTNIRYRIDGGDPSATDGHLVYATQNLYFEDPKAVRNLRMVTPSGTATVHVTYYK